MDYQNEIELIRSKKYKIRYRIKVYDRDFKSFDIYQWNSGALNKAVSYRNNSKGLRFLRKLKALTGTDLIKIDGYLYLLELKRK